MHKTDARTLLSSRNGMNIYRGCQHGCIYCDSRSKCYQFTHDFEDIEVKQNAPELLGRALRSKRKRCMIGTGSMSDPYMPLEQDVQLMRQCLELIDRHAFGATVITKSNLVLRDLDLYLSIHEQAKALVKSTDIYLDIIKSQSALLDAQAQQLHYQKLLMDLSKGLLLIGSYNQQTNQALYQELKKQLSEASEKEIGELGMRELQSVATQLKEHQDMLTRMDAMEKKLAELTEIVNKLAK